MNLVSSRRDFGKIKKTFVKKFLTKNKLLVFLSVFLLLGILFGAVLMKVADKDVIKFVNALFLSDFNERLTKPLQDVFISSISSTFVFVLIAFFMGLSMWGFVLAPIIPFARGICIGLCEGYLYSTYGAKGICFHSLVFLPGIFMSSAAVLLMSREAMRMSNHVSALMLAEKEAGAAKAETKKFLVRSLFINIVVIASSTVDAAANWLFLKSVAF